MLYGHTAQEAVSFCPVFSLKIEPNEALSSIVTQGRAALNPLFHIIQSMAGTPNGAQQSRLSNNLLRSVT